MRVTQSSAKRKTSDNALRIVISIFLYFVYTTKKF